MILQFRSANPCYRTDLENSIVDGCTHRCTRVDIRSELAEIIAAWPSLSDPERNAISLLAGVVRKSPNQP